MQLSNGKFCLHCENNYVISVKDPQEATEEQNVFGIRRGQVGLYSWSSSPVENESELSLNEVKQHRMVVCCHFCEQNQFLNSVIFPAGTFHPDDMEINE